MNDHVALSGAESLQQVVESPLRDDCVLDQVGVNNVKFFVQHHGVDGVAPIVTAYMAPSGPIGVGPKHRLRPRPKRR